MEPPSPHEDRDARIESEILYWFIATAVPIGGAPEEIRRQWLGVPLPVRDPRPVEGPLPYIGTDVRDRAIRHAIDDGVAVAPADALLLLRRFDRGEAADWWEELVTTRPMIKSFVFRRTEGDLLPPRMAEMLYPELHDLDLA